MEKGKSRDLAGRVKLVFKLRTAESLHCFYWAGRKSKNCWAEVGLIVMAAFLTNSKHLRMTAPSEIPLGIVR